MYYPKVGVEIYIEQMLWSFAFNAGHPGYDDRIFSILFNIL